MTSTMVLPSQGRGRLQPLDAAGIRVTDGFWAERLTTNRTRTIPHGRRQLEASGALGNFRNAARASGRYVGGLDDAGITFPFLDSDVYKWLEAAGWELGRGADPDLAEQAGAVIEMVTSAQRADGYLGTFVQLSGREPYADLAWGHELYCIGHLTQAAVAWQRSLGDDRLTSVASRAIEHIEAALGPEGREGIDGHPEIEMALVELYRLTGQERFLTLARLQVDRRGRGLLGSGRLGARYWQDHVSPLRAPTVAGHAVRQLYLDCGVVDLAVETGDQGLLDAVLQRWSDMWATRSYLTGGLGSRHRDEAFGDPFELPPDRAYTETCAAIANVMLSWRLLLATGESRFADAIERTLYNAVLPGLGLDGTHFFYTNPLQLRPRPGASGAASGGRAEWYPCACCPPNLMRTLSTFEQLVATRDQSGLQLHQYADVSVETTLDGAPVRLRVETGQPWDGGVAVVVDETPPGPWTLQLRVPAWLHSGSVAIGDESRPIVAGSGTVRLEREWRAGERLVLDMAMAPRLTSPDPRIDAVRGCVAIERGPLVYCIEQVDLEAGIDLEDVEVDVTGELKVGPATVLQTLEGVVNIEAKGQVRAARANVHSEWPYRESDMVEDPVGAEPIRLIATPYFAWANRRMGPMRVWLPRSGSA